MGRPSVEALAEQLTFNAESWRVKEILDHVKDLLNASSASSELLCSLWGWFKKADPCDRQLVVDPLIDVLLHIIANRSLLFTQ